MARATRTPRSPWAETPGNGMVWCLSPRGRQGRGASLSMKTRPALARPSWLVFRFPAGDRFYVSSTALPANASLPKTSQGDIGMPRPFRTRLTPPLRRLRVELGDFGLRTRNYNGTSEAFFSADAGAQEKLAKCPRTCSEIIPAQRPGRPSRHLHRVSRLRLQAFSAERTKKRNTVQAFLASSGRQHQRIDRRHGARTKLW